MAAWRDLHPRVEGLRRSGLVVQSVYRSKGLPGYLQPALEGNDVYIVGAKGVALDDTLCLVRLSKLEELVAASAGAVE